MINRNYLSMTIAIIILAMVIIFFSFKALLGDLYHNVLTNDVKSLTSHSDIQSSHMYEETHVYVDKLMFWENSNPDYLIDISYFYYLLASIQKNNKSKTLYLNKAIEYVDRSIGYRPLFPDAYTLKADLLNYKGEQTNTIYSSLEKAYKAGPYEKATARVSIKLLYEHWEQLSFEQKKIALRFVTHHDKYGIPDWKLNEIIKFSPQKSRLCSVVLLSHIPLWTCGNYVNDK